MANDRQARQMAATSRFALPGDYTLSSLPDAAMTRKKFAWVTDRPGGVGWMVSNGTGWSNSIGPPGIAGRGIATAVIDGAGHLILTYTDSSVVDVGKVVGNAATITAGGATPLSSGASPTVSNSGSSSAAVFNFGIPAGAPGAAATVAVGTVSTLSPGASATVVNAGSSSAAVFNFGIPAGAGGSPGAAATIAVGSVTGLAAGATPTIVNAGTSSAAVFNFGIPAGAAGSAATVSVGAVTTLAAGASATVTNGGSSSAAVLNFGIPQGAAGFGTVAPSTPARTLGTTFQPHATKAVQCSYSIALSVTNPLLAGNSTAQVVLLSDASNPPTTERCRATASSAVGVAVAIALTTGNTVPLDYLCPPGHYVRLVSTTNGTASTSIVAQVEEALG